MKGGLKTVRLCDHSSKTNFNDWSDSKCKIPPKRCVEGSLLEKNRGTLIPQSAEISVKSVTSQTSIEIEQLRGKIRRGEPLLSKKEIHSFRLPFYESLLKNLHDDGFLLTYEFINDLIAIDDAYHKKIETDFNVKNRAFLKFSNSVLIQLSDGLIKAETAKVNEEKTQEATAFLDLATYFSNPDDKSWHWVAQEMFEQCIEVVDNLQIAIDLQLKATAKYLYASFLFYELHDLNNAKMYVEDAMKISETRYWTIDDTEGKKGNNIYFECCLLLHEIFLEMAQEQIDNNIEEAIQFCRNSLLWAKITNSKSAEANSLKKLIKIYLSVQQFGPVLDLLQSYMKLCKDQENVQGLCDGHILFAAYHDMIGDNNNVIEDIKELLKIAEENQLKSMVAMAHHKLAIWYLSRGKEKELKEHAVESYTSYVNLDSKKEMEETRCLTGIAQAQEIMPAYCELVVEADNINYVDLLILLRWKNLRIPFFNHKILFQPEAVTNEELLVKVESLKNEELLADIKHRQKEMVSMASVRLRTLRQSISSTFSLQTKSFSLRLNKSSSIVSRRTLQETKSTGRPTLQKTISTGTLQENKSTGRPTLQKTISTGILQEDKGTGRPTLQKTISTGTLQEKQSISKPTLQESKSMGTLQRNISVHSNPENNPT